LEEKDLNINVLLIVVAVIFLVGAVGGWNQGLINGVIGLVSFIIGLAVLGITASCVGNYLHQSYIKVGIALALLAVIGIIYKVMKLIFDAFKFLRYIPIGKFADKLAGIALGIGEALFLVWIAFFILDNITILNLNSWVFDQISQSDILTKLYNANIIDSIVSNVASNIEIPKEIPM
jgi:uncharacterized membrane protein required for colicin V production